jgi:ABC-type amino acid transport substrate-binding protein
LEHWRQTDSIIQGLLAQVVFSKAYPHYDRYVAALQQGIRVIRNNGLYTRILEKYYGKGKVPDSVKNINQKPYTIPKT